MPIDITKTLRKALKELQAEREKIDSQIAAIERVLVTDSRGPGGRARRPAKGRKRTRKPMSAAARKAVGRRMKAYWAKRREQAAKAKEKAGK